MDKYDISYIIGAYNEEKILAACIDRCIECLSRDFRNFELILVDDGSSDGTGGIMDAYAEKNPCIRVLHNDINLNFGVSIQRGLKVAQYEYVLFNGADLPLDPAITKSLLEQHMGEADLLVLQRIEYLDTTGWRRVTSLVNRAVMRLFYPGVKRGIRDTNYVQVFRREIIPLVLPLARSPIFTWPEMIFRARYQKLRVVPLDIAYKPLSVRKGAFGKPHDIIWGLYDMLRFRAFAWKTKWRQHV